MRAIAYYLLFAGGSSVRGSAVSSRALGILFVSAAVFCAREAAALTRAFEVGGVKLTAYAPDWAWQNSEVNVLFVLQNMTDAPVQVVLALETPAAAEMAVDTGHALTRVQIAIQPHETVRSAFTGMKLRMDAPLTVHNLEMRVGAGGDEFLLDYPLRAIRGQIFGGSGLVVLLVPAGVALVWCLAFLIAARRYADRGAWKRPGPPVESPLAPPAWADEGPAP